MSVIRSPIARPHTLAAILALTVAPLLAFNLPPSSTFLNQAASLVGFGAWLAWAVASHPVGWPTGRARFGPLEAAFLLALLAVLGSWAFAALPSSLAFGPLGAILAAALVAWTARQWAADERGALQAFRDLALGLVVAGILSSAVGLVQVFAPRWPDGNFIAPTYIDGRAVGNMRQPNHLSSLLLWSTVAVVWLGEARALRKAASTGLALLFIFVVVLTASRTGALSMALLLAWGTVDRRLSKPARRLLLAAPLIYFVFWYATGVWADQTHHVFGGETRFSTRGDPSSSRFGIWSNALALLASHPWLGVGWGNFNFAWTLTPFPGRPVAFFDHTHDLILQFLVELGVPLGALLCALLGWALWRAWRGARRAVPAEAPPGLAVLRGAALLMVALILVHSLLEYPLWYVYYLLPAAFAFGICLAPWPEVDATGRQGLAAAPVVTSEPFADPAAHATLPPTTRPTTTTRPRERTLLLVGALLLALGGLASVADYARVVAIFAPARWDTRSLAERIANGRHSWLFEHHADYAAATNADRPAETLPAFRSASHYLLDARLLEAWATALDAAGDTDRARYVAARLREFRNDQNAEFFAPCEAPPPAGEVQPFQCQAPQRAYRFEDFR